MRALGTAVVMGVLCAGAMACGPYDLQFARCDNNDNCPSQQFCDRDHLCHTGETPIDYACEQIATALADRITSCVGGRSDLWLATAQASILCREVVASVGAGRMTYAWRELESCKRELEQRSCTDIYVSQLLEHCTALQPAVAPTQACTGNLDCAGGFCDTSSTCPGLCRAFIAPGGACTSADKCEFGSDCTNGHCTKRGKLGDSCGFASTAACEPTQLFCDGTSHCAARKSSAASCNPLLCWTAIRAGQDLGLQQLGCSCAQGANCVDYGSGAGCVAARGLGEACVAGRNDCQLEFACLGGVCAPQPRLGEPCGLVGGEIVLCAEGRCSNGVCSQFVTAGQSCGNGDCGATAHCDSVCRADVCPSPATP